MEHLIIIKTRSEYVCDETCPWLSYSSSQATGHCALFGADITVLPPQNIPMRTRLCIKSAPHPTQPQPGSR